MPRSYFISLRNGVTSWWGGRLACVWRWNREPAVEPPAPPRPYAMASKVAVAALAALVCLGARAESFDARFDEGYALLQSGNPEGALESFQRLLTENPDSSLPPLQ